MIQYPQKLQRIVEELEHYHTLTASELDQIRSTYCFLEKCSACMADEHLVNYSMEVARFIASWRFNYTVVIAAMVYRLAVDHSSMLNETTIHFEDSVWNVLNGCTDIHQQIALAVPDYSTGSQMDIGVQLIIPYPESFYVLVAERVVVLSNRLLYEGGDMLTLAKQTREIMIPQVKRIHAYKIVDILEELCFQIESKTIYLQIQSSITQTEELCSSYRKQFITKLRHIFDPKSHILPAELKRFQPHIKLFQDDKRSLVSIYRFITRTDTSLTSESSLQNDMEKIKNICRTAYYDLTLVVDDTIKWQGECTIVDLFMEYFNRMLRPDGVYLYGFYPTTGKESYYFLLSDPMKNMYRFFLKNESEYLHYLYGDIFNQDKLHISYDNSKSKNKIKVFRRDGSPDFVEQGTTVLDFAFMVHEDLGLHFGYAKLNNNDKAMPPYTVINNGDTVEIIKSDKLTADLNWFRYVKTDLAINYLIKYYKAQYLHTGSIIKEDKKDGG